MSGPIKVAVAGHRGKVGSILAAALAAEPDIEYVGGVGAGDDLGAFLHEKRPQALVDFTQPAVALHHALAAGGAGPAPRIRTTNSPRGGHRPHPDARTEKKPRGSRAPHLPLRAPPLNQHHAH